MEQHVLPRVNKYGSVFNAITSTGLLIGSLVAASAALAYELRPARLFQYIASGVFGKDAILGGLHMAFIGLIFHFIIAFSWTYLFFSLYTRIKFISAHKYLSGLVYGIVVWAVMNLLILPLTSMPFGSVDLLNGIIGVSILMMVVGLPISILTHRYYSGREE